MDVVEVVQGAFGAWDEVRHQAANYTSDREEAMNSPSPGMRSYRSKGGLSLDDLANGLEQRRVILG